MNRRAGRVAESAGRRAETGAAPPIVRQPQAGSGVIFQIKIVADDDDAAGNDSDKKSDDMYTELKKLKELLEQKVIAEEEFDAQKKKILGRGQ